MTKMSTKPPFDFAKMKEKAKKMSTDELRYAIKDIVETLKVYPNHPNEGWYQDEASTYRDELNKRADK